MRLPRSTYMWVLDLLHDSWSYGDVGGSYRLQLVLNDIARGRVYLELLEQKFPWQ